MYAYSRLKTQIVKPAFHILHQPKPILYTGNNSIKHLAPLLKASGQNNILLVTDKNLVKIGLTSNLEQLLIEKKIKYCIFDNVKPNPSYETIEEGYELAKINQCDAIVAIGGGSVLDAAKVIAACMTSKKPPQHLQGMLKIRKRTLPLYAIPTTAGTGSETTVFSVITDSKKHKKVIYLDPKIIPQTAILDPNLLRGLPKNLTSTTALDALTHAIESYISDYATPESKKYSEIAIKLIFDHLENVYENPEDLEARMAIQEASFYAGLAFSYALIGYVHAFSHNLGGALDVPHGLANAVILPHIIEFSKPNCIPQLAKLANLIGLGSKFDSQEELADLFVDELFNLNKRLEIPSKIETFNKSHIDTIIKGGFKECHGTYPVPKYLSYNEAYNILSKVAH